jgi:hypothetical protein
LIREVQKCPSAGARENEITTERIQALKADMADFLRRQSLAVGVYADEKDREEQYYRGRPRG